MRRRGLWDTWLLVVAAAMVAFGVFMAIFGRSQLFEGFNAQIGPVFWPTAAIRPLVQSFQGWAYSVWGATVAGFGLLVAFVARGPFRARQTWARNALVASIALWFILDTGISAMYGVWFNVGFNASVLLAAAVPLGATWREFGGGG